MRYFMNAKPQQNGDYEVHNDTCSYGKKVEKPLELGNYLSCQPAVQKAEELYGHKARQQGGQVNGCYYCCNPCHTQ